MLQANIEVLFALLGVVGLMMLFSRWMKSYLSQRRGQTLFRWRGVLFGISFVLALTLIHLAFEWKIPIGGVKTLVIPYEEEPIKNLSIPRSPLPPGPPPPLVREVGIELEEDTLIKKTFDKKKREELAPAKDTLKEVLDTLVKDTIPPPPPLPPPPPDEPLVDCGLLFVTPVYPRPNFPSCEALPMEERKACADKKMLEFIYSRIKYPPLAEDVGAEGMVVIQFTVDKMGFMKDAKIVRDIGFGYGEVALAAINAMITEDIRWVPGKQRGRPVPVHFNIPIRFRLE